MEIKEWISTVYGLFFSELVTLSSLFQRRRDLENQNVQQNVQQIFLILKQTAKLGCINSMHFSSLLRSSTVSEFCLTKCFYSRDIRLTLTGLFIMTNMPVRSASVSVAKIGLSCHILRVREICLSAWIYSGFNANKIKVQTSLFLTLATVLAQHFNYPGYLLNVSQKKTEKKKVQCLHGHCS